VEGILAGGYVFGMFLPAANGTWAAESADLGPPSIRCAPPRTSRRPRSFDTVAHALAEEAEQRLGSTVCLGRTDAAATVRCAR
jgi:hypothetical protein